ncbi:hypothetical protein, partial [Klebsiella aerogenes]|uniref:hypothetical protein n=1 Tax=Klebsiella aerogenes TaxID=548 RepID=UPI001CC6B301
LPVDEVNPTVGNKTITAIGGGAKDVSKSMQEKNQVITDALARNDIGFTSDTPITKKTLDQRRDIASEPYKQISRIPQIELDGKYARDLSR